ncbi:MAG: hypothetical protein ACYDCK_13550 [Thermoplasmatota archaeon]
MSNLSRPALALAIVLTLTPLVVGHVQAALPSTVEDWENGYDGWTTTGNYAAPTCAVGAPGCSLQMVPECCNQVVEVTKNFASPYPIVGPTSFSYLFRSTLTGGDTDTWVTLRFEALPAPLHNAQGGKLDGDITLSMTDGAGNANNAMGLITPFGEHRFFGSWTAANTWYVGRFLLDPATHSVTAELRTQAGALLATSKAITLPVSAIAITGMSIDGISYSAWSVGTWNFDTITTDPLDPTAIGATPTPP